MAHKIVARLLVIGFCLAAAAAAEAGNIGNTVYGFYSETFPGMKFNQPNPGAGGTDGGYMGFWEANKGSLSTTTAPTDGDGIEAIVVNDYGSGFQAGVFMQFGFVSTDPLTIPEVMTNMGAYEGGSYTFMIRANSEVALTIKDANGYAQRYLNQHLGVPLDNQWHMVSVPLTVAAWGGTYINNTATPTGLPINFYNIKNIAFATKWVSPGIPGRTFAVDNVLWIKPNPTPAISATLKRVSDHVVASSITWSNVALGATKVKAANQYIELNFDYFTPTWGIQIYTDNKALDANPRYRGTGNPAGLVGQLNNGGIDPSSTTLAMCWRITDSTVTAPNIQKGAPGAPDRLWDANVTPNGDQYPCFFWMKDKGTLDDPLTPGVNEAFINADDYVAIWDKRGIHHAEGDNWGTNCYSPNYVYLGADFSYAIGQRNYTTGKLIVELYNE